MLKARNLGTGIVLVLLVIIPAFSQGEAGKINVTVYRDLVRFAADTDGKFRVQLFNQKAEKVFDSDFVSGVAVDWFRQDQLGQPVDSGLYGYSISVKNNSGKAFIAQRGNVIVDLEREGLIEAPPLSITGGHHTKGVFRPYTNGVFDVNASGGSYNINAARMGIGTANPLVRLQVGAGAVAPVTAGSTLLIEEAVATAMVVKSSTGAEMFFYQDAVNGTFGTASTHPLGIRTNNFNRIWITSDGKVGIGTTSPGSIFTVAGVIESTSGGVKFPDGTTQITAAGGGAGGIVHGPTLTGNGTSISPLNVVAPLYLTGTSPGAIVDGRNDGDGWGLYGRAVSGIGVFGEITSSMGTGVYGKAPDYGVAGLSTAGTPGFNAGVYGEGAGPGGTGVFGGGLAYGVAGVTRTEGGNGVYGEGLIGTSGTGVNGMGLTYGVLGNGGTHGVFGHGEIGVYGDSTATNGRGVIGVANSGSTAYGVWGKSTNGFAGFFDGNVQVVGTLSKSAGAFKIDHPLDPENKYLSHSFVESPDMMNIYNGNITLDENGEAVVKLPEWFDALNKEFRYQLTCIGGFAQVYIAEEIADNSFKIAGGRAGLKVSWQVTGVRKDPYAEQHRIRVEEQKPEKERGYYLHPDAYGQPEEKGIEQLRRPEREKQARSTHQ